MLASVRNNAMATSIVNRLNRSEAMVVKSQNRIASGNKFTSVGDAPAEYSISQKMSVQLRTLQQSLESTQRDIAARRTTTGYLDTISNALQSMSELAQKAANGVYTNKDRELMQKQFSSDIDIVDDAAWGNGGNSLGVLANSQTTDPVETVEKPVNGKGVISANAGDVTILANGSYTIEAGYTGKITVLGDNVELHGADRQPLKNVNIECKNERTNLWLDDLSIENSDQAGSAVKFKGIGNVLHTGGNNSFRLSGRTENNENAVISSGEELTVKNTGVLQVENAGGKGAGIGTDAGKAGSMLSIEGGTVNVSASGTGAAVGAGENANLSKINIKNAVISLQSSGTGAAVGAGGKNSMVGVISLEATQGTITNPTTGFFGQNKQGTSVVLATHSSDTNVQYNGNSLEQTLTKESEAKQKLGESTYYSPLSAKGLGLTVMNVNTAENAKISYDKLQMAMKSVREMTASVGASEQALNRKADAMTTELENLQSAQSLMADTDLPKELVQYNRNMTLTKVNMAMLSKTNKDMSWVLNLLG